MEKSETKGKVLKKAVVWKDLYFYRKSDTVYQLTVEFCRRFLPAYGDRTVDQMVQAARSGKQNIVEGSEDGQTSSEMEIKLMNVARGSLQELRSDYLDYLHTHHLAVWEKENPRQQRLREFCHQHNDYADYEPLMGKMNDEEMANLALTLCHQTDKMMCTYDHYSRSYTASFTEGEMKTAYGSVVPAGWLKPLDFIRLTKTDGEEAKVRLIVPHSSGTSNASGHVQPFYYEISYMIPPNY